MLVVDLADEFGLTTNQALDVCDRVGIPAATGGASVSQADADRFRGAMAEVPDPTPEHAAASGSGVPDEWLQPGTIPGDTSPLPGAIVAPVRRPTKRRRYKKVKMSHGGGGDSLTGLMALVLSPLPLVGLSMTGWSAGLFMLPTIWFARSKGKSGLGTSLAVLGVIITVGLFAFSRVYVMQYNAGQTNRSPQDIVNKAVDDVVNFRPEMPSAPSVPTTTVPPPTQPLGPVAQADVLPGDCLSTVSPVNGYVLHEVQLVSCATPHDAQVISVVDPSLVEAKAPGLLAVDGSRPADAAFAPAAAKTCAAEFTRLVGGNLETSPLGVVVKLPTLEEWATGTHSVSCAVASKTGLLVGPLAGGG